MDRELVDLFMGILRGPCLHHMISNTSSSFSDMVIIREHVETCIKAGTIPGASVTTNNNVGNEETPYYGFVKKNEGESRNVSDDKGKASTYPQIHFHYYSTPIIVPNQCAPP